MNTTVASSLCGKHIGKRAVDPENHVSQFLNDKDVYIVMITHSKDGIVTVRWGYEKQGVTKMGTPLKPYKKNADVRYQPDYELRLV